MGMIVLGCSIWAFYDGKTFARLIEEGAAEFDKPITLEIYRTSSVLLMIASVIIILIAFFGCCGAIKVRKFREIVKKIHLPLKTMKIIFRLFTGKSFHVVLVPLSFAFDVFADFYWCHNCCISKCWLSQATFVGFSEKLQSGITCWRKTGHHSGLGRRSKRGTKILHFDYGILMNTIQVFKKISWNWLFHQRIHFYGIFLQREVGSQCTVWKLRNLTATVFSQIFCNIFVLCFTKELYCKSIWRKKLHGIEFLVFPHCTVSQD